MTKPILTISAKAALYNAVSDAEETYLETVRDNHFRGDRPTPTELYHKGIYCALYGLVCRFGLEADYLDWRDEPATYEDDENDEEDENEDDEEDST
jgi:hypothetical protein